MAKANNLIKQKTEFNYNFLPYTLSSKIYIFEMSGTQHSMFKSANKTLDTTRFTTGTGTAFVGTTSLN